MFRLCYGFRNVMITNNGNDSAERIEQAVMPGAPTEQQPEVKATRVGKVLALSLGSTLTMIASLVSGMIAARWLSKHDYATIKQTFLAYEFVAPLLMLGLPNAIYYFLPREKEMKRGVIVDNMVLLAGFGLLFSLFLACGGYQLLAQRFNNPDLRDTLQWLIPYPLLLMPLAGFGAVMVCANRIRALTLYNVFTSLILTIAGIVAILYTKSYAAPIVVRIVIPFLFLPVAIVLMFTAVRGRLRWPRWSSMWGMLRFSVPLGLATMLGSITLQLHSIIVAALCSPEDFAVYINGAIEIPVIGIVTGSITMVVFAEMADLCHKGDKPAALALFHTASLKSACILLPTMCFLLVAAQPFILFLFSTRYQASVTPFVIYLLVLPARVVTYGAVLMALGMTRVILVRSIFDLAINCVFCLVLVKVLGYVGAALGIVLTLYLWSVPYNMQKIASGMGVALRETLPFRALGKILLISLLCVPLGAIGVYAFATKPILRLGLAGILYWPIVAYLLYRAKFIVPPAKWARLIPAALRV